MEWNYALPLAIIIVLIGMLVVDIITFVLSDEDPDAQSYWFSFFEDRTKKDRKDKPKVFY